MAVPDKPLNNVVAINLRQYREIYFPGTGGKTKCANALSVKIQQWSAWENGQHLPSDKNMQRIAALFNVTENELRTSSIKDMTHAPPNNLGIKHPEGLKELISFLIIYLNNIALYLE